MGSKKLLVADDSLTIQKVIRLALANEGYEIQAISDGNDAVQHISLFQPDLVLIDVSLPGKSAFEVKRAVNQESDLAPVRFVLMSSAFERVDEAQAAEVVFHGRLTKPFDPGHLREVLQQVFVQNPPPPRAAGAQILPQQPPTASRTTVPSVSVDDPIEGLPLTSSLGSSVTGIPGMPQLPDSPASALPSFDLPFNTSATPPPVPQQQQPSNPNLMPPSAASAFGLPLTPPVPPSATPSLPPAQDRDSDADIRELTETTIRMSGLNDFEWSVQEPSLKPPRSLSETNDFPTSTLQYFKNPTPVRETSRTSQADSPSPFELDLQPNSAPVPPQSSASAAAEALSNLAKPATKASTTPSIEMPRVMEPDPQMIEEMVSRRVEEALQKSIQKLLPDLAEKLIKEQIRQMLSE